MGDTLMGVVRLDVYSGEDALFSRQFEADSITIGSGPEAMMRVVGSGLASLHAVITIGEDKTARLIGIGAASAQEQGLVGGVVLGHLTWRGLYRRIHVQGQRLLQDSLDA